jgi:hypothetical protein
MFLFRPQRFYLPCKHRTISDGNGTGLFKKLKQRTNWGMATADELTSLKRMMLGWRSERWLMISLYTFSSICRAAQIPKTGRLIQHRTEQAVPEFIFMKKHGEGNETQE